MTEQLKNIEALYNEAISLIENSSDAQTLSAAVRTLRSIVDTEAEEGTTGEEILPWQGLAAYAIAEVYREGLDAVLRPDPLRAHYYIIMAWSRGINCCADLADLYYRLEDYYHAAMYYKAVVDCDENENNVALARERLAALAAKGIEPEAEITHELIEFEDNEE